MEVTLGLLKRLKACGDGIEFYKKVGQPDNIQDCVKLAIENNNYRYANWFITRILKKLELVKYAVFAAEQVLYLYENKYPDDDRPRKAIEAAKKYINDPSSENASSAASTSASAAASSASASSAAAAYASAVYASASAAASSASAAAEASSAAASSASAAAEAASNAELKTKIINYGLSLIEDIK
jgi:hypothetical protein